MREGWVKKTIGKIASVSYGHTDKASPQGDYRYVRITDIDKNGELDKSGKVYLNSSLEAIGFILNDNDLLMARTGATFAKVLLYEDIEPSIFASYLIKISFTESISNRLYWYFSKSEDYWEQANHLSTGSAQPHFNGAALKKVVFTYPVSLTEQKQIVELLDQAFAAIDQAKANIEKNIQNAKELFQSKLNEIFSQKGEGWEEKTLGEVCEIIKRGIAPKYINDGGLIVINQKCIRDHKINLAVSRNHDNNLKKVNPERLIKLGDVLVNSTGTGTLGRVAQIREDKHIGCTVDTHVTIVRPKKDLFFNDFFGFALIKIENEIIKAGEGASGQTELAKNKLEKEFKICFPHEHKLQKHYVFLLDSLTNKTTELVKIYESKLSDLEEFKKAILQKAFTGELTEKSVLA